MITIHERPTIEVWMKVKNPKTIAKLMAIQGVSQRAMAARIGYKSHTHLRRILKGDIGTVTTEKAALIANVLGVGVDDLFLVRTSNDNGRNKQRQGAA